MCTSIIGLWYRAWYLTRPNRNAFLFVVVGGAGGSGIGCCLSLSSQRSPCLQLLDCKLDQQLLGHANVAAHFNPRVSACHLVAPPRCLVLTSNDDGLPGRMPWRDAAPPASLCCLAPCQPCSPLQSLQSPASALLPPLALPQAQPPPAAAVPCSTPIPVTDPRPAAALQYPEADILTSSDHLSNTNADQGLESWPEAASAANIGIMLFRPSGHDFAKVRRGSRRGGE